MRLRLFLIGLVFMLAACTPPLIQPGYSGPTPLVNPGNSGTGVLPSYCHIDIGPTNPHPDCPYVTPTP